MALCAEVNKIWMFTRVDVHYKASQVAQIIKNPPANAVDPWVGKTPPGEENGYPLQYSCLDNSIDRRAWQATVYRVRKSQTRLSNFQTHFSHVNFRAEFCFVLFFLFGMSELRAIEKYNWRYKEIIHIALISLKMLAIFSLGGCYLYCHWCECW